MAKYVVVRIDSITPHYIITDPISFEDANGLVSGMQAEEAMRFNDKKESTGSYVVQPWVENEEKRLD